MYERYTTDVLRRRLAEPRRFIQAVVGPRQVGKTTSVRQALDSSSVCSYFVSADSPAPLPPVWIEENWAIARAAAQAQATPVVLALDEIQKIAGWSEAVKRQWDADTAAGVDVRVVLLGSSALLVQKGLTESLAGRHEVIHATHWTFAEMRDAFGWDLETFVLFGGYPGPASLTDDPGRWRDYVRDSLIETAVARDVLSLARIDKPALLRRLFALACEYSGRELSYTKMLGQLEGAGNTTTLAHYLDLLDAAGLATGLQKHAGEAVRRRGSSPKLLAMDTALVTAMTGVTSDIVRADRAEWGRLVETAVGAHLLAWTQRRGGEVRYWRDGGLEVDYIVEHDRKTVAIEVKSGVGLSGGDLKGLQAFSERFSPDASLVVGTGGVPLEEFLGGGFELPI